VLGARARQHLDQVGQQLPLAGHGQDPVVGLHHVVGGDALEHRHLGAGVIRHDQVGLVAHPRARVRREGRRARLLGEAADHVAGEVLQGRQRAAATVVRRRRPGPDGTEPCQRPVEGVFVGVGEVPVAHGGPDRGDVQPGQVDAAGHDAVLDVVHGVGDVVGEVHHLRLEAPPPTRGTAAEPVEDQPVVVVHPELAHHPRGAVGVDPCRHRGLVERPRVLGAGVEGGPGQVQPRRAAVVAEGLRLQPGQQPQGLGVALEPPDAGCRVREHSLPVVAERRVAEVVCERGGLDEVGLTAQRPCQVPRDLGDLEAVGQPVADEVVALRPHHLGLRREPTARRGVHEPGAVTLERGALGRRDAFGRLVHPALPRGLVVQHRAEGNAPPSDGLDRRTLGRLSPPADRVIKNHVNAPPTGCASGGQDGRALPGDLRSQRQSALVVVEERGGRHMGCAARVRSSEKNVGGDDEERGRISARRHRRSRLGRTARCAPSPRW
jgi:hypothetical protein